MVRRARIVRQRGQLAGWGIEKIATAILDAVPDLLPLEAWRLAFGWTRPQALAGIAAIYRQNGLAVPGVNSSMLCRWEHGEVPPSAEYVDVLCRLYRAGPDWLGLSPTRLPTIPSRSPQGWYGLAQGRPLIGQQRTDGSARSMANGSNGAMAQPLAAIRESIQLALEVEGPAGGPLVREQLDQAIAYYSLNYAKFPPGVLAIEVSRCRALVAGMLTADQPEAARPELRRLAGWLSALLGNLAFHLGDDGAAQIHFSTATSLATDVGEARLIGWSLGAQSMVARLQNRPSDALDLANRALEHASTPLSRAQLSAWAKLPSLIAHGDQYRREAITAITTARHAMDADPAGEQPGRFGFDRAELDLHIAEAHLGLGNAADASRHAQASADQTSIGRPGWAAATLVLARSESARQRPDTAAELAHNVLDTVSPAALRDTTRRRLAALDRDLAGQPGIVAADLHQRVAALPALASVPPEPSQPDTF